MKWLLIILILLMLITMAFSDMKNEDNPLRGEWDFQLKEAWSVDRAGDAIFSGPDQLLVSETGTLYVKDGKNKMIYIFGKDGKFIKAFGNMGEGPGELKHHLQIYLVKKKFIAADIDRLHYFTHNGIFIKSVKNFFFEHRPEFFLNENELITFPLGVRDMTEGKGKITLYNIKSESEKHITEFSVFKGGSSSSSIGSISILKIGLTPMMTLGYDNGKFIYGMSHSYVLNITDINGKHLNVFSLKRKKEKISNEERKKTF